VFARVLDYVTPLAAQARKWPEDAFVWFLADFLYEVALASKHKVPIASSSIQVVREFVPIIDPREFKGEARFRLAECVSLICDYDVDAIEHANLRVDISNSALRSPDLWRFLDFAEFRELTIAMGALGYAKVPDVGLRRLRYAISDYLRRPEAKPLLAAAGIATNLAGIKQVEKIGALVQKLIPLGIDHYRPAFVPLGPVEIGLYRSALAEASPEAEPPEGKIMVFEGKRGISWLGVGEENKLEKEAADLAGAKRTVAKARAAMSRFH
jgi:hypothetical protein